MGSFSLPSKIQGKYSPTSGSVSAISVQGNETVSMSIHWPVSEMHPSEITAVLNFPSAMLNGAYDT